MDQIVPRPVGAHETLTQWFRSRSCTLVSPERSAELWQAFVGGRLALVRGDWANGHRFMLTRHDDSDADTLTPRECQAASLALRGQAFKEIAFELGVAPSTGWTLVTSALRKLGLRSRVELAEVFGFARIGGARVAGAPCALPCPPKSSVYSCDGGREIRAYTLFAIPIHSLTPPECLSNAERDVVRGVLDRKSNAEIAVERRTSKLTVANQLRSVYMKLGISGRAELIAAC
jgi:DNA-binding CsgD family transcriptional regulator